MMWLSLLLFQDGKVRFLICTDVAARGIDVSGLPFGEKFIVITVMILSFGPGVVARLEARPLGMQAAPSSIPKSATFFRGDVVMKKKFDGHSSSSADSRRAVVSYWRKNVHCKLPRRLSQEQCG